MLKRIWSYIGPPWSWQRVRNLVYAAMAAVPGVRRHVLSTTPLKAHPTFNLFTSFDGAIRLGDRERMLTELEEQANLTGSAETVRWIKAERSRRVHSEHVGCDG